jgi:hypothetical protein
MSNIYTLLREDTGKRIYINLSYSQIWKNRLVLKKG